MDEQALIRDAKNGNLDAFNRLVLAYQDIAFNIAFRMLGDDASAEDATQTAFISAFKGLVSYRGGSFKAWVLRMVTNACYDELRRRHRRPTVPLEPLTDDEEEVESPRWLADEGPSPEETMERAELEEAIQDCLTGLPEEFREVILLIDVQGLDYSEVSVVIGKPLGTIKSRLARARLRLRTCLQGFWELLPAAFRLEDEAKS
ncbi:MAG TPA: sigma-70 family RNA polymerase sigma factor [Anaerolineaceae bacterium]|nr:sigma-70 family RNA polymerase sigma factor [Anaerolineaceae bacterium]